MAHKRPPLHLCALTLLPHSKPVAAPDGSIFDHASISQLIARTNLNPISGQPLAAAQLTPLLFSTDPNSQAFRCPILFTPFTTATKVVAIQTTGRVYSADAISRLNIQPNYMRDLIDATPFTLQDLIILYDPTRHIWTPSPNDQGSNSASASPAPALPKSPPKDPPPLPPTSSLPSHKAALPPYPQPISIRRQVPRPTMTLQSVHRPASKSQLFRPSSSPLPPPPQPSNALPPFSPPSSNPTPTPSAPQHTLPPISAPAPPMVGPPLPQSHSRSRRPQTNQPPAKKPRKTPVQTQAPAPTEHTMSMAALYQKRIAEEQRKAVYKKIRKGRKGKGYVRVVTNIGHLNIELHCDKVPTTCDNFLTLAERKFYDGLSWHRVVPGFIAQTGDPTGKGDSGESAWGGYIKDEIRTSLNHDAPGVVSMANSGRDTNTSQWFVCFDAAPHLDGAHTVFGKVVGGLFVLKKMESEAEMGHPLTVQRVEVLVNPIRQIRQQMNSAEAQPITRPAGTASPQSSRESGPSTADAQAPSLNRQPSDSSSRRLSLDRIVAPELPPAKTLLSAACQRPRYAPSIDNR